MKICIDPGHGGSDPGAIGPTGLKEKDITLLVAQKVADKLQNMGVNVKLTRTDDNFVSLEKRCKIANNFGANYFVSIHCNSATNSTAKGTETYHAMGSTQGQKLAQAIQEELIQATGLTNRGVKTAGYYVLRYTNMPAALTELAFISNAEEEKLLKKPSFQEKVANAIVNGIAKAAGIQIKEDENVQKTKILFEGKELEGFIVDGKSYAEVRKLAEMLGLKVEWNATKNVIELRK
jgi:N-acetylmuramoyl-L-alanine amidase